MVIAHNEPDQEEIAMVKDFQKTHPNKLKHIIFDKVTPLGFSWNKCIQSATGDFLTIWNIDDQRTNNSIELQAKKLEDNRLIDVVYGNYKVVDKFGSLSGKLIEHKNIPLEEFSRSMVWGPFFMFRKSMLSKTGLFDEQFRSALDFDFCVRTSFHAKAKYISENLGWFLSAQQGLSTNPNSPNDFERTAIELRYGIYDKIDYTKITCITKYNLSSILFNNRWYTVETFIPDYKKFLENRKNHLLHKGLMKFTTFYIKKYGIIAKIKRSLKKCLGMLYENNRTYGS